MGNFGTGIMQGLGSGMQNAMLLKKLMTMGQGQQQPPVAGTMPPPTSFPSSPEIPPPPNMSPSLEMPQDMGSPWGTGGEMQTVGTPPIPQSGQAGGLRALMMQLFGGQ